MRNIIECDERMFLLSFYLILTLIYIFCCCCISHFRNTVAKNDRNNVEGGLTIFTDGQDVSDDLCALLKDFEDFGSNYKSGQVDGVDSIEFKKLSADGVNCGFHRPDSVVAVSSAETLEIEEDKSWLHEILWPLLLVVLLVVGIFYTVHRRRQKRRALYDIEDRAANYIDEMRPNPLNSVDVHACHSAACTSCVDGKEQTKFIATNSPSWLDKENPEDEVDSVESIDISEENSNNIDEELTALHGDEKASI